MSTKHLNPIDDKYYITAVCGHCGCGFKVLRRRAKCRLSQSKCNKIFCSRACSQESQKVPGDKRARKSEYDKARRNGPKREQIMADKRAYYKQLNASTDPEVIAKRKAKTQQMMPYHLEFCRTPRYRAYKREYDAKRRAARYGEFTEVHEVFLRLQSEIKNARGND